MFDSFFSCDVTEIPLSKPAIDGGFCGIFQTIGIVGDSLSAGEFEEIQEDGTKHCHDCKEYSWGTVLGKLCGAKIRNFSRGGMSASEYCQTFGDENGYFGNEAKCQAYILALGVNDIIGMHQEIGTLSDIDLDDWRKNRDTFAGWYAQIIQRYREIEPRSRIFLVTMPRHGDEDDEKREKVATLLRSLPSVFHHTYVIDFYQYAPVYDAAFRANFFLGNHMTSPGYHLTGRMIASYLDYIIRHNMQDFKQAGFIGTPWVFAPEKW